ncbi:hypothetical protein ACLOJK_037284, partial [Asimina triloba]
PYYGAPSSQKNPPRQPWSTRTAGPPESADAMQQSNGTQADAQIVQVVAHAKPKSASTHHAAGHSSHDREQKTQPKSDLVRSSSDQHPPAGTAIQAATAPTRSNRSTAASTSFQARQITNQHHPVSHPKHQSVHQQQGHPMVSKVVRQQQYNASTMPPGQIRPIQPWIQLSDAS